MGDFDGKAVLITGGASGIGRATAQRFLEEGARVALVDRDQEKLEQVTRELNEVGPTIAVHADVSSMSDGERAVHEAVSAFGPLHVVFCNAGIPSRTRVMDLTEAEWDRVMDTNVKGMFSVVKPAARHMRDHGTTGSIVLTASEMSFHADAESPAYVASKGAVLLFMKAIALDLVQHGIRVNAICPGLVETPMTEREIQMSEDPDRTRREWASWAPIGRASTAEEQAEGVLFLASSKASFVVGTPLLVDGGSIAR